MSKLPLSNVLSVLLVVALASTSQAKSNEAVTFKQAKASLKGKTLTLRHLYSDNMLVFDDQFKLVKGETRGAWTLDGLVQVQKVSLKDKKYLIVGNRILQKYDPARKGLTRYRSTEKFTMELPATSATGQPVDLRQFVQKVFLKAKELYPEDPPDYWKPYLTCVREKHPDCADSNRDRNTQGYPPKFEPKPGMTYPQPIHREEPEYNEPARQAKLRGTSIFLVAIDKEGQLRLLEIIRPLGLGLDESAAEKLSEWKYSPATQEGQPVDVRMDIEILFEIR